MLKDRCFWVSVSGHVALALLLIGSAKPFLETPVTHNEPAISVVSITAEELDRLLQPSPSTDHVYAQALTRQIEATEQETQALSHLIALTEQSIRDTVTAEPAPAPATAQHVESDRPFTNIPQTMTSMPTTQVEPVPYEDWSAASATVKAEPVHEDKHAVRHAKNQDYRGIVSVSVDPLIVYQHQLISHIKLYLPKSEIHVECAVKLSLSPAGQVLSVDFNTQKIAGCDAVRHAISQAGRLPGSQDPDVLPFLSSLELRFNHG